MASPLLPRALRRPLGRRPGRRRRSRIGWVTPGLLSVLAPGVEAGFPLGTPNVRELEQSRLRHVCSNAPAVECRNRVDPNLFDGFFDASECPAADPEPTCVIGYVPGAQLRGLLTVIADDPTPENQDDAVPMTVLFELRVGEETFVLSDVYPDTAAGIGAWFPFDFVEEDSVFRVGFGGGQFFPNELAPLGARLSAIAQAELGVPADAVPVIQEALSDAPSSQPGSTPANRKQDGPELDASASTDPLGSVARYRITIRFARPFVP